MKSEGCAIIDGHHQTAKIIQEIEAAQRRQVAATGEVGSLSPFNSNATPPAPVSKQSVDFTNPGERERWLRAQPNDVAVVFAAHRGN
jgi:hypothetical protein